MLEHTHISERRACRLVGLSRDAWRHPPQTDAYTVRLGERIHAVAMERRRFGYLWLSSPPSTATPAHQPPMQDQLTYKLLGLSPTDWYGWRGQVNGSHRPVAQGTATLRD